MTLFCSGHFGGMTRKHSQGTLFALGENCLLPPPLSAFPGLPEQRSLADYWVVIKIIIKEVTGREHVPISSRRVSIFAGLLLN